ncbi:MAG: sugar phosphate isomerase/epimerase [Alistipes sp.]|jgi:sugar phosphate isomerase/epimerase|nr:sugar phosphate isomerase/epimerase [Alistipes sp.]
MKKLSTLLLSAVAVLMLASCGGNAKKAECCGDCSETLPIGLQLYSVRDAMEKDFKGTLQQVKAMGYDGVEFAGLFNNSPAQVKAWCEEIGLNPISAHVPLADMLADIDKVIADYKAVGCKYIVVPYVTEERRPGGELFMQMVEEIRAIGEKCKAAGLVLLYHNHDFEFKKLESGEFGLDYLYANVPADLLQTELDQCWVKYSGQDPVAYLQKYSGRSPVVHLKDFHKEGEQEGDPYALIGLNEGEKKQNTAFEFRPLGKGVQDIPSIIAASEAAGSKWLIVEQDQPSMGKSPMECVAMSMEYLKSIYGKPACKDCQEAAK